jgi:hypothetical protein
MPLSRRAFIKLSAGLAIAVPGRAVEALPAMAGAPGFQPKLLLPKAEIRDRQLWLNRLGPRLTASVAHQSYVESLGRDLASAGLRVQRERYLLNRWDADRWSLAVHRPAGGAFGVPVTSYYPYSGETPPAGVTGELADGGTTDALRIDSSLRGKIALVASPAPPLAPTLTAFKDAGAVGVVLGWTNVSDANAADQYVPFTQPYQGIPALWVGRSSIDQLREFAGSGASATLTLEANITPGVPTDTLIATLPGASADEIIIVNTHTDGPNFTEENGGIAIVALARYFARVSKNQRKRTLVFILTTGHFACASLPSIRDIPVKHPDLIKKAVAAVTIEHLGAMEWKDDAQMRYAATGRPQAGQYLTRSKEAARLTLDAVQGGLDPSANVSDPGAQFLGEGRGLVEAGVPTIGYLPSPDYLLAASPNGCADKFNLDLMYGQIQVFARLLHAMDGTPASVFRDE